MGSKKGPRKRVLVPGKYQGGEEEALGYGDTSEDGVGYDATVFAPEGGGLVGKSLNVNDIIALVNGVQEDENATPAENLKAATIGLSLLKSGLVDQDAGATHTLSRAELLREIARMRARLSG